MKRYLPILLLTIVAWCEAGQSASAQSPVNPITRPTFSPYLNLLRRDNNPAINYYGLVRPEIEFRNSMNQVQQQLNSVQSTQIQNEAALGALATGHRTQFQSYGHYFPAKGGAGAGGPGRSVVSPTYPGGAATLGGGTRNTTGR
ncbi:MAG: hypothetical protein JNM56_37830 [Planctomycetia bacterium]|nr:hypothetical protein [Planctomycetia bacterium]